MLPLVIDKVQSILCLGAHADDIEIGCGGTILRLVERFPAAHFHWVVFSGEQRRAVEARGSAGAFLQGAQDVTVSLLNFRDGYFPYLGESIKGAFEELKTEVDPDLILTHCGHDRHQDHHLLWELTWNTFRHHLVLEYEIPKYEGDLGSPNAHVGLSEAQAHQKAELLMRYFSTQTNKHWFTADLFLGLMRLRGIEAAGATPYAEGFHARKFSFL